MTKPGVFTLQPTPQQTDASTPAIGFEGSRASYEMPELIYDLTKETADPVLPAIPLPNPERVQLQVKIIPQPIPPEPLQRGYTGSRGIQGFRGNSGFSGSRGYVGSTGAGFTGSASTEQGYTGSIVQIAMENMDSMK